MPMFFLVGKRIYLNTFDEDLGVYPEVELCKDEAGNFYIDTMEDGIEEKPAKRSVCTLTEIVAKFGATVSAPQPEESEDDDVKE